MCKPLNKLHKQTQYTYEQGRYPSPPHCARTAFLFVLILMVVRVCLRARVCKLPEREVHSCRGAL